MIKEQMWAGSSELTVARHLELEPGQLRIPRDAFKMSRYWGSVAVTLIGPCHEPWTKTSSRGPYWWVFSNGRLTYFSVNYLKQMMLVNWKGRSG